MAEAGGEVVAVSPSGAASGLSNGAGAASAQTSNPLSRKLHKILETRLDNDKVTGAGGVAVGPRGGAGPGQGPGLGRSGSLARRPPAEGTPAPRARLRGAGVGGGPGHYSYLQRFRDPVVEPRPLGRVRVRPGGEEGRAQGGMRGSGVGVIEPEGYS